MNETNKQLPPELVEKMQNCINSLNGIPISEQCAQIAVDYAESGIINIKQSFNHFKNNCEAFKQQRDELLEALKLVKLVLNPAGEMMHKIEQLIQKHDSQKI